MALDTGVRFPSVTPKGYSLTVKGCIAKRSMRLPLKQEGEGSNPSTPTLSANCHRIHTAKQFKWYDGIDDERISR